MKSETADDVEALRSRLDELNLQLLAAIDAAHGAEAERAVVEARVQDLEHQHHMLKVERDHLRAEVARLRSNPLTRSAGGVDRLVRGVGRRVVRGRR